jgi:hypothetical protein
LINAIDICPADFHYQTSTVGEKMNGSDLFGRTIAVIAALGVALSVVEPAFADWIVEPLPAFADWIVEPLVAVPGPIVGAGLPGLVVGGVYGAIWLTRKLRHKADRVHWARPV